MPRKGFIAKRDVLPDPMYNSKVVTKLINNVMEDGKKGVAQKICYEAFEIMAQKTGKDALEVFEEAMNNVMITVSYILLEFIIRDVFSCRTTFICLCLLYTSRCV